MNIVCDRGVLLDAIVMVSGVVPTRSPKPSLLCVRLSAKGSVLSVYGTDLEASIQCDIDRVEVNKEGEVIISADKLRQIVRESRDDTLSIDVDRGGSVNIHGSDSHYRVAAGKLDGYPASVSRGDRPNQSMPGSSLKGLIAKTQFAASTAEGRYAFSAVLFESGGGSLKLVATDGRRLALAKSAMQGDFTALVPFKAVGLIDRIIGCSESVGIEVTTSHIRVWADGVMLTSSLSEGSFPPYNDVIPVEPSRVATIGTEALLSACRRAGLMTTEESKGVRCVFASERLTVAARSPEAGEATVTVPCKLEGNSIEIGFNPAFLADALRVVDTPEVTIEMSESNRPALLRSGPDFKYVLMPVLIR